MEERFFIKNNRGLKLAAVLHRPEGDEKFPAAILLQGFLGTKESVVVDILARNLAENGIVSISFDPSGWGESEGTLEADYRLTRVLEDLEIIYNYLLAREDIDTQRIGLFGQSMGGVAAIVFGAKHSDVKALCVVSLPTQIGGRDDLKEVLANKDTVKFFEVKTVKFGTVRVPIDFIVDANTYLVVGYVLKIEVPILVVWGTDDKIVPWEDTKKIFEAANEPKEFFEVPGMGHKYYRDNPDAFDLVNKKVAEFFKKNL